MGIAGQLTFRCCSFKPRESWDKITHVGFAPAKEKPGFVEVHVHLPIIAAFVVQKGIHDLRLDLNSPVSPEIQARLTEKFAGVGLTQAGIPISGTVRDIMPLLHRDIFEELISRTRTQSYPQIMAIVDGTAYGFTKENQLNEGPVYLYNAISNTRFSLEQESAASKNRDSLNSLTEPFKYNLMASSLNPVLRYICAKADNYIETLKQCFRLNPDFAFYYPVTEFFDQLLEPVISEIENGLCSTKESITSLKPFTAENIARFQELQTVSRLSHRPSKLRKFFNQLLFNEYFIYSDISALRTVISGVKSAAIKHFDCFEITANKVRIVSDEIKDILINTTLDPQTILLPVMNKFRELEALNDDLRIRVEQYESAIEEIIRLSEEAFK